MWVPLAKSGNDEGGAERGRALNQASWTHRQRGGRSRAAEMSLEVAEEEDIQGRGDQQHRAPREGWGEEAWSGAVREGARPQSLRRPGQWAWDQAAGG